MFGLESNAQAQLDLAPAVGQHVVDQPDVTIAQVGVRGIGKVRSVGQVIRLDAELAFYALRDGKVLEDCEVHVGESRSPNDVSSRGARSDVNARGVLGGHRKGGGIHVIVYVAGIHSDWADQVCTRRAGIAADGNTERSAALQRVDGVQLPAPNQIVHPSGNIASKLLTAPERQFIQGADGHNIVHVLSRQAAFQRKVGV